MLVALILLAIALLVSLFMALRYREVCRRLSREAESRQKTADDAETETARLRGELSLLAADNQRNALFMQTRAAAARNELALEIGELLAKPDLKQAQKLIRDRLASDETAWADFMAHFNSLFGNFSLKLTQRHPDLTRTELRLCCYLKMNLPTKEIAPLLGVSPRSVEMTRYRLRKKLALAPEANLADYIKSF